MSANFAPFSQEKLVQSVLDARTGERADSQQEKARKAGHNLLGQSAIDMGNSAPVRTGSSGDILRRSSRQRRAPDEWRY